MSLSVGRTDVEKSPWLSIVIGSGLWIFWISFVSLLSLPAWLKIPMTGLLILHFSQVLPWALAGLLFVGVSWIFHQFSQIPPGLFWLSCFCTFLILKLYVTQVEMQSITTRAAGVVLSFLFLELFQLFFVFRILPRESLSLGLVGGILASVILQSLVGLLVFKPLKGSV